MNRSFKRLASLLITMILILCNTPVRVYADTFDKEVFFGILARTDQFEFTNNEGVGIFSATMTAYGSMWLTLTQFQKQGSTFETNNGPSEERKLVTAALYQDDRVIARFSTDNAAGPLGKMELPTTSGNIGQRYGCKILIRPPMDNTEHVYYFKGRTANGEELTSAKINIKLKPLTDKTFIPPTVGKTDGFTSDTSSIKVYTNDPAETGSTGSKEMLITLMKKKKDVKIAELTEKLKLVQSEGNLEVYRKAIKGKSSTPEGLAAERVAGEDLYFETPEPGQLLIYYDRDYVKETDDIIRHSGDYVRYKSIKEGIIHYYGNSGDLTNGANYLEQAYQTDHTGKLAVMVCTGQSPAQTDASLAGSTLNTDSWNLGDEASVGKKYYTEVMMNIVALYTGEKERVNRSNKTVRAFIFTNENRGTDLDGKFTDTPSLSVRAAEIAEWSALLTEIRKYDEFMVGTLPESQILRLYPEGTDTSTLIAAKNKWTFAGADSKVEGYGSESDPLVIDKIKSQTYPDTASYYNNYYTNYRPSKRFLPETFIFTPTGALGGQIGYRIIYEDKLLDAVKTKCGGSSWDETQARNVFNSIAALDTDAYFYFTGKQKTTQELSTLLYEMVSPAGMMAEDFMIDSFQDMRKAPLTGTIPDIFMTPGTGDYLIPEAKGCVSFDLKIDNDLSTLDNESTEITTTLSFGKKVNPDVELKLDAGTLRNLILVEKKVGSNYKYDKDLTAEIKKSGVISFDSTDNKMTIKFPTTGTGAHFGNIGTYRIKIIFPVVLRSDISYSYYKETYLDALKPDQRFENVPTETVIIVTPKPKKIGGKVIPSEPLPPVIKRSTLTPYYMNLTTIL